MQFSGLGMDSYALDTGMKRLSVYKATRSIKRRDNSLYNALRSIYDDSIFVGEISQLWPELPLLANLRCGLWYSQNFYSTCYFKSTDGHTNNWSFNTSRLNLHVALLAGQRGGCMIVDSTRKGKRFPDSMSKTIPIWTCVLNRAIMNYRKRLGGSSTCKEKLNGSDTQADEYWDCSLRLPLWVSETEKALIEDQLESWTADMDNCGADIASLALTLRKPLRPLWISQKTVIWLNEVPEYDSWDFTPVILLTASSSDGHYQQQKMSEFSWNYIPGAGDDEESWARGLSPHLFWKHAYDIISSGPDSCNQKVADIVEKDRVFRAQRSDNAPQVTAKFSRVTGNNKKFPLEDFSYSVYPCLDDSEKTSISSSCRENGVFWLDSTNVAVGSNRNDIEMDCVDSVLDCDTESLSPCPKEGEAYLHLPIVNSKFDRFSLVRNLPCAVEFAKVNLRQGKRLLICCKDGEDISVCVCLAILLSLFDDRGNYDEGKFLRERDVIHVSKEEMRRRLVYICKYAIHARPCRGNLKQVFHFLNNIGP